MTKRPSDEDVIGQIQAMAPEPERPAKAAKGEPADVPAEAVTMPVATVAALLSTVDQLLARVDRGETEAAAMLKTILADHGMLLKQNLSPENRLHPDISDLNPLGERDHPRPPLRRQCFFLGIPLERAQLTLDEITLLNSIPGPLEIRTGEHAGWRVAFLRDGSLYISVPYRTMDDVRSIEGGWQRVLRTLMTAGSKPQNSDYLLEQLTAMQARIDALETPTITPPA